MSATMQGTERTRLDPSSGTGPRSGYRWTILALLFFATTINYLDRQVFGLLAPTLQRDLGWSEADYGNMVSWFSFAYAIGMLGMGRLLDRIGSDQRVEIADFKFPGSVVGNLSDPQFDEKSVSSCPVGPV